MKPRFLTEANHMAQSLERRFSPDELRARWADAGQRADIIQPQTLLYTE